MIWCRQGEKSGITPNFISWASGRLESPFPEVRRQWQGNSVKFEFLGLQGEMLGGRGSGVQKRDAKWRQTSENTTVLLVFTAMTSAKITEGEAWREKRSTDQDQEKEEKSENETGGTANEKDGKTFCAAPWNQRKKRAQEKRVFTREMLLRSPQLYENGSLNTPNAKELPCCCAD